MQSVRRHWVAMVVAVGLAAAGVRGLLQAPAARAQYEPGVVVRVPRAAVDRVRTLDIQGARRIDYDTFVWMEVSPAEMQAMTAAQVPFDVLPDAGRIHVPGRRFDPLREGPPPVPARLTADAEGPGLRLVQLQGPARDEWLAEMKARGVKILQYYPHNTYLVWDEARPAARLSPQSPTYVRWEGAFEPAYKIEPALAARSGPIRNLDVMIYDDGNVEAVLERIRAVGGEVIQSFPSQPDKAFHDAVVVVDAAALDEIARIPTVVWMGYMSPRPRRSDEMTDQIVAGNHRNGVPQVGYREFLDRLGYDGTGVTWAVIDEGVDYDHPDLGPRIVGGYEFPGACNIPGQPGGDCSGGGHGTHVAGIIGGSGITGLRDPAGFLYGLGVAPGHGIFAMNSVRVFRPWPPVGGWQEHSKRAVLGGAVGGNSSWGTGEDDGHGYQAAERTHDWMTRDGNFDTPVAEPFIQVFAAGNSGPAPQTLVAPQEAKNTISVGRSGSPRSPGVPVDAVASGSSRGPTVDGRIAPTVTAPGEDIASTANDEGGACATPIEGTNGLYALCTGTSMAAPHVSGAAVLITQWWKTKNEGSVPSPAMVKALLVNSAVDMGAPDIPNFDEGWGRVDVAAAIAPSVPRHFVDQSHTFAATGAVETLRVKVADCRKPLKVTLVWTDAPGAVGANPALVNDLDLSVETGGRLYRGNVFEAGWSRSGGGADLLNNVESVYLASPGSEAVITVAATAINGDGVPYDADPTDQDYALVCQNCIVSRQPLVSVTRIGTAPDACRVRSTPEGIDCGPDCSARFPQGKVVRLTVGGRGFKGWGGACSGTQPFCRVVATGSSVGITARCDLPPQTLTVTKQGAGTGHVTSFVPGIDCGDSCAATFTGGTLVGLAAVPRFDSRFTGWGGDCAGQTHCRVTMTADRAVSAAFEPCVFTPITYGQSVAGLLADPDCMGRLRPRSFADRYTFTGTAGDRIVIAMSGRFDSYLYLFGPSGELVAENDNGGGRVNARIPATAGLLTLPATGTYTIEASAFWERGTGTGTYTLSLQRPPTP